jgi:hypothetical protein
MCTPATTSALREEPLDAVLRPIHNTWVEETRRFLDPAIEPRADFWTRWAAVRYLFDDFRDWYRRERALVDELRPFFRLDVAERLAREGDRLFRLRLELDRIGRRRGTAAEFAAGTRDLLEQLGVWCAEIELAADGLTRDALPAEATDLLAHLEAAAVIHPAPAVGGVPLRGIRVGDPMTAEEGSMAHDPRGQRAAQGGK